MKSLLMIVAIAVTACGEGDSSQEDTFPDYIDQPVTGTINDNPWTYVSGRAQIKQDKNITIELYSDNIGDVCADAVPLSEGRWAEFVVPDQKGETIYAKDNQEFYAHVVIVPDEGSGFVSVSDKAKALIVNRSEDMVFGKYYFESVQKKNILNGTFQVPVCKFE